MRSPGRKRKSGSRSDRKEGTGELIRRGALVWIAWPLWLDRKSGGKTAALHKMLITV